MTNHIKALMAMTAVAFGMAGCSRAAPAGHLPAPPSVTSTPAAAAKTVCTRDQLRAALDGSSQPGTAGTALATVYIWNTSARACTLRGPITVTGLNQSGHPITSSVRFAMPPRSPRLSPDAIGPGDLGRMPAHEITASMLLIAAGTHSSDPGLGCPGHDINPASWRITLPGGGSITTPNTSTASGPALTPDGGLTTCHGRLHGQSPILIARA